MASDVQEKLRDALQSAIETAGRSSNGLSGRKSGGPLSGTRGLAVGAGAAALAPLAVKNIGRLFKAVGADGVDGIVKAPGKAVQGVTSGLGDRVGSGIGEKVSEKVDEAGGPGGILKDTLKSALPFGGGGGGAKGGAPGVGKGRRMPVQQSIDIGVPIETVYNQWTQFEDWPTFMHRVTRVTQEDDCTVSFATKIWGKTKEFTAQIETQRPNERIKWKVSQGITHTGVVTFHELGPQLTRVLLGMDVEPGGLLEKAARGMRHVKRAARADLHRFKALIEMSEHETGAWRGVIEDGDVVEEHDPSYDRKREYADLDDVTGRSDEDNADDDQDHDEDERESAPRRTGGRRQGSTASPSSGRGGTRGRSASSSSSRRSASGHSGRRRSESRGNRRSS